MHACIHACIVWAAVAVVATPMHKMMMTMCVCVYIHTHTYTYTHTCTYAYAYTHMCIHAGIAWAAVAVVATSMHKMMTSRVVRSGMTPRDFISALMPWSG